MYICCECKEEMKCTKNGVGASFGNFHVYPGDRYECPICGYEILATNTTPVFDPEYCNFKEYLKMSKE